MAQRETAILTATLVALSARWHPRAIWWRNNTGTAQTKAGGFIRFGLKGSPDILGCLDGRFIGVETKTPEGRLSDAQRRFRAALERAGGLYIIARSPEEAIERIEAGIA